MGFISQLITGGAHIVHSVKTYNSSTTITKWMVGYTIQYNFALSYTIQYIHTHFYMYY